MCDTLVLPGEGGFLLVDRGAQADRIDGGSWLVSQRMAAGLGDAIVLGAPVRRCAAPRGTVPGSRAPAATVAATGPTGWS